MAKTYILERTKETKNCYRYDCPSDAFDNKMRGASLYLSREWIDQIEADGYKVEQVLIKVVPQPQEVKAKKIKKDTSTKKVTTKAVGKTTTGKRKIAAK